MIFKRGELRRGDARELIRDVADESVDLVFTDPPFGVGFDELDDPGIFTELEDELWRVLKPDSWLVFYWSIKRMSQAFKLVKFRYVWQIIVRYYKHPGRCLLGSRRYDPILIFRKGTPKMATRMYDIIPGEEVPQAIRRPRSGMFKPTYTNYIILKMFSHPLNLILDPFAGFGSIPFTCEISNRRWMAFEIDNDRFNRACQFIKENSEAP